MATIRQAIPERVKSAVYERYGHACWLGFPGCDRHADTLDHIYPYSCGGRTTVANLRPACRKCNSRRQDRLVQGRGIDVRVVLLQPGDMEPVDHHGRLLDYRRVYEAVGHEEGGWGLMAAAMRGATRHALRIPATPQLTIVPSFDIDAKTVREWIRLGYQVERLDRGSGFTPSNQGERQALGAWKRHMIGPNTLRALIDERDDDWKRVDLAF